MTSSKLKWPRGQNDLENWSKPSKNPMLVCGKCYISSPKSSVDWQSTTRILDPLILDLSRDESFIEYFAIPQSPRALPYHPISRFQNILKYFGIFLSCLVLSLTPEASLRHLNILSSRFARRNFWEYSVLSLTPEALLRLRYSFLSPPARRNFFENIFCSR